MFAIVNNFTYLCHMNIDPELLKELVKYVTLYGLLHPDIKSELYNDTLSKAEELVEGL